MKSDVARLRMSMRRVVRAVVARAPERWAQIDTRGYFEPSELGVESEHSVAYTPSGWLALRRALRRRDVDSDDVFLDFGSGMGRVVYQAAKHYPFRRVIGLELSEQLHHVATGNLERNHRRLRCTDVHLVHADAASYAVPDDVTVVYLYNPFGGPVFSAVVDELHASVTRRPRRLRVIYVNPAEEHLLLTSGFRCVKRIAGSRYATGFFSTHRTCVYELGPPRAGPGGAPPAGESRGRDAYFPPSS